MTHYNTARVTVESTERVSRDPEYLGIKAMKKTDLWRKVASGIIAFGVILANPSATSAGELEDTTVFTNMEDDPSFHHHHFGIFTGYADKDSKKSKGGFKTGFEYEYQFTEWLGVRGFVDYEAGKLKQWLYGAGASFHIPNTGFVLFAGGGIEQEGSHDQAFFRLDLEYQIHLADHAHIAPVVGYDFPEHGDGAWFMGVMWGFSL